MEKSKDILSKLIVENSRDAICILDDNGYFLYANPAFEKSLGINPQNVIGVNFFSLVHPNDCDYVIKLFEELFIKDETLSPEVRLKSNIKNTWITFEAVGTRICPDDQNSQFVITLHELTERYKWEEDIVRAKEKAEEMVEFKSWFLSAMSHEIRTPLNVILGYTNLLKDFYKIERGDENSEIFRNIERAGKRLLNTITQILDLSRVETGEFPVNMDKVNLNALIKIAYEIMQNLAEEKNLRLVYIEPENVVHGWIDEYCLSTIITNLLSNSIKYSDAGVIKIILKEENGEAKIIVSDEGIGMSDEYQKHLFEVFKRDEEVSRRKYEGSGFGLALTKKFVDMLNGKIEFKSIKNIGTKVIISIPLNAKIEKLENLI